MLDDNERTPLAWALAMELFDDSEREPPDSSAGAGAAVMGMLRGLDDGAAGSIAITCAGVMNGFEWSEAGGSIQLSGILVCSAGRSGVVISIGCVSAREMTRPNLGEKKATAGAVGGDRDEIFCWKMGFES